MGRGDLIPAVVTVFSSQRWEQELVDHARFSGLARVVARCQLPSEVAAWIDQTDVVVVGGETPWLSPAVISLWRRMGAAVVGVVPPGDQPARRLLAAGGADLVADSDHPPERLLARVLALALPPYGGGSELVVVTGPRGAAGRSEVALAAAWGLSRRHAACLLELDAAAPGLGLRLGLAPQPHLGEAVPGELERVLRRWGGLQVGLAPPRMGAWSRAAVVTVVADAVLRYPRVVIDAGPVESLPSLPQTPARALLVCDATPTGVVRAAGALSRWDGPTPLVVLNRAPTGRLEETRRAVQRALAYPVAATLPTVAAPGPGAPPSPTLVRVMRRLLDPEGEAVSAEPSGRSRERPGR